MTDDGDRLSSNRISTAGAGRRPRYDPNVFRFARVSLTTSVCAPAAALAGPLNITDGDCLQSAVTCPEPYAAYPEVSRWQNRKLPTYESDKKSKCLNLSEHHALQYYVCYARVHITIGVVWFQSTLCCSAAINQTHTYRLAGSQETFTASASRQIARKDIGQTRTGGICIVDNRGTIISVEVAAKSISDGYTLLAINVNCGYFH